MNAALSAWLFPRASEVEPGWIARLFRIEQDRLRQLLAARANRRHADQRLRAYCGMPEQPQGASRSLCSIGDDRRRALAVELGWVACAAAMRRVVASSDLLALVAQAGEDRYGRCLGLPDRPALLDDPVSVEPHFIEALAEHRLREFVAGLGVGVLDALLGSTSAFARRRLSLCVSPHIWRGRPRELAVADSALDAAIHTLGDCP